MNTIFHALILNLHQPSGNLEELLATQEWEARQILLALDRIPRSLWPYEDIARVHLSLSGTLLETLANQDFQRRTYGIVKCGDLLWHLQNEKIFRILGTAYYHPVLPLIPPDDWLDHLARWQGLGRHLFWREHFRGFWPPEMGFCMELIPLLQRLGFHYVLVDSEHVEPMEPMRWEEIRYRPHVARFGDAEIIVVVRDRELSDAQESGMDESWFRRETIERTKFCDFPPLIVTASDGDNGGWFRNVSASGNFWGAFYQPLLERVRRGETEICPAFIEDYLARHGAQGEVRIRTGAWNTGWHHGRDFMQWTGSQSQKEALQRISATSQQFHSRRRKGMAPPEQAHWRLLRAQTSCNFFWGEAWLARCHRDLDEACRWLGQPAT